ncbi:MAG: DUF615 domain-containing protein [Gammaproteobacteria bacterium]|nr:DUF615 domain-containing protein [Gammaproteobacteria bacterium]MDE2345924.1 DUF615 domain-containing protein [Gammaproteobacteria bacterium]
MDNNDHMPEERSRTQVKRAAEALQKLGERLMALPKSQLDLMPLPDNLRNAIEDARRISARGALKRQRQYIGRLMRDIDPQPLRAKLEEFAGIDNLSKARFHQCQYWRDRLLAEGDAALAEFLLRFPQADRQHLRRLLRDAVKDAGGVQQPRRARELFRYLQGFL